MNVNRLLVSSCLVAAVLGTTAIAASTTTANTVDAKSAIDTTQKPPDKPKAKAPDKPKPPAKAPPKADKPKEAPPAAKKPLTVGSEVDGAMTLTDIDAKAHKMSDMRGKVVVIHFWSAHSPDETAWDKKLAEIETAQSAKGVQFIGVDSDKADFDATVKDPSAAAKEALKARGLEGKMPLVLDKDGSLMTHFSGKAAPYAVVIDAKGIVRYAGPVDEDIKGEKKDAKHYLNDAIDSAMAAKPAAGDGKEPPKK